MQMESRVEFKKAIEAITSIKERLSKFGGRSREIIKDHSISPIINNKTLKEVGFSIAFQLNTMYDYGGDLFGEWKERLGADSWLIHVNKSRLYVHFTVHYSENA